TWMRSGCHASSATGQYARGVYEWKRRILRLAGQIRQLATRAVLAARRKETGGVVAEEKELPAVEHRDLETAGTPDESSQTR
ncbi:hypothetical protein, partial [Candidatus Accumulibacter phosphatis]|uniref:hypothetical protein n=1 Tax=Candidatus Accumulibacter phosphatis TaxID=327160 RepID=UPI001B7EBF9C